MDLEGRVLTIQASGTESLWDEILPAEVKALPDDLARLDELLSDPALLAPIGARWEQLLAETGASPGFAGQASTIAMESYVRLMIVKHRSGWGYETLMREVSDSLHLRRFCRIGMTERVPDEVDGSQVDPPAGCGGGARDHTRTDREGQAGEAIPASGGADRLDRRGGGRPLADGLRPRRGRRQSARQEGLEARDACGREANSGQGSLPGDGSQAPRVDAHDPSSLGRGQARGARVDRADRTAPASIDQGGQNTRRYRAPARAWPRCTRETEGCEDLGGARRPLREGLLADSSAGRGRTDQGPADLALGPRRPPDPQGQARPDRPSSATSDQLCEITANTKRGARGFILPPKTKLGNPAENTLLPDTATELKNLDITLKEIVLDGGFMPTPSNTALENLADTIHITGRQETGSRRTRRRRQRYRTGAEGRSATSNAATAWTDHASKATPATRSGPAGRRSATTPRPTPPSDDTRRPGTPGAEPGTGNRKANPEPNPGRGSAATTIDTPLTAPPGLSGTSS